MSSLNGDMVLVVVGVDDNQCNMRQDKNEMQSNAQIRLEFIPKGGRTGALRLALRL